MPAENGSEFGGTGMKGGTFTLHTSKWLDSFFFTVCVSSKIKKEEKMSVVTVW